MRATQTTAMILHPLRAQIREEEILRQRAEEAARRDQDWIASQNPTPFGEFLQALNRIHGHESMTNAGYCHWVTFPLHEALAHGLWVVMLKTAEKLQHTLDTKDDVVQSLAPRIDRMINLGMVLSYGDGTGAAHAFEQTVVPEIVQAAKSIPRGQSAMLQEALQLPVAKFFADLIKATTTYRADLIQARTVLRTSDRHRCGLKILRREVGLDFTSRHLTLDDDSKWELVCESVATELESLNQSIQLQRVLAKLPAKQTEHQVRLQAESPETEDASMSIEVDWINTELMLAAAKLPSRGFIDAIEEYPRCVKALRRITDQTLSRRFFKRLAQNQTSLTEQETELLETHVLERIQSLRALPSRFSVAAPPSIIYGLDIKHPNVDSMTALEFALHHVEHKPDKEVADETLGRHLATKIPWENLNASKIKFMAQNKVIPPDEIAQGIGKMRQTQRRRATKYLIESFDKRLDPKTLDVLTRLGLMKITPIFISNNLARLPKRVLEQHLPYVVKLSASQDDPVCQRLDIPKLLMRMIGRLDSIAVREILNDPTLRRPMVRMVEENFWVNSSFGSKVSPRVVNLFLKKIGDDLWRRYALAAEVSLRKSIYGTEPKEIMKEKLFLPPWEELEDDDFHSFRPSEAMGISKHHARVLLKTTFTEDKIFLWLHAEHDTPRKCLAAYQNDRRRYFEFMASVPKSQRTD